MGILPPPTDNNNDKRSILKDTREAKGLTLEIVHEATKIPMDALRAIEEGYSVRILSPFYYRGFIKIYSEFLGLDIKETYKHYGLDQAPAAPAAVSPKVSRKEVPNVFLEQLQELISFIFKPKNLKFIAKVVGFLLVLFFFVKMAGCIASHMGKKIVKTHQVALGIPKPVQNQTNVYTEHVIKHESVQAPSEDNKVEVAVRAFKDTWLRVKADDRVVFEMTLKKGSMESWNANKSIELSGRNIEQLDLEVNNKQIGVLGGGERRIKKVLITPEGLTVKK